MQLVQGERIPPWIKFRDPAGASGAGLDPMRLRERVHLRDRAFSDMSDLSRIAPGGQSKHLGAVQADC